MPVAVHAALTIERSRLIREADLCAALAAKSDTIPITRCVLMVGDDDGLRLATTDTNHTIIVQLRDVAVPEPFTVVVDAVLLSRVLRSMAADDVTLTLTKEAITVTSGLTIVELPVVYDAELFPSLPGGLTEHWTMPLELVQRLLAGVEWAMTDLESQFTLAGVYVTNTKKTIDCAATDGKALALTSAPSPRGEETSMFIPKRAVQALSKLDGESVTVGLTENDAHIAFRVGDRVLYTLANDFRSPNFRGELPKSRASVVLIGRDDLVSAIRRALVVTEGTSRGVRLELSPKRGRITVRPIKPQLGTSTDQIPADFASWSLGDFAIGLDSKYLLPALEAIACENVRIEFAAADSHPVIVPADQPELYEQFSLIAQWRV